LSPRLAGGEPPGDAGCELVARCAMGTHWRTWALNPLCCLGLEWELPLRTAGNDEQASSVATPAVVCWQRSRKPGPSLLYTASPVERGVCRFRLRLPVKRIGAQATADSMLQSCSGRLSGLLSGCPPTDTRPQARAKLGDCAHKRCEPA